MNRGETVADLEKLSSKARFIGIIDYNVCFSLLKRELTDAIRSLQSNANLYAQLKEEGYTGVISIALKGAGWNTACEANECGHCDLSISHPFSSHIAFLGEAKIWGGACYYKDGMKHLLNTYNQSKQCKDCIILCYFKEDSNMHELFPKLKAEMVADREEWFKNQDAEKVTELSSCFSTMHNYGVDCQVHVHHYCVDVRTPPQHASTLRKKAAKAKTLENKLRQD